jgi:hypothetical protein
VSSGTNPAFSQTGLVTIAASTTTANATLPTGGDTLVVTNPTAALAWVAVGGGTPGAAVAGVGYPILPGAVRAIGAGVFASWIAVILNTGAGSIYVETGTGSAL